jgi:hypothetical protein
MNKKYFEKNRLNELRKLKFLKDVADNKKIDRHNKPKYKIYLDANDSLNDKGWFTLNELKTKYNDITATHNFNESLVQNNSNEYSIDSKEIILPDNTKKQFYRLSKKSNSIFPEKMLDMKTFYPVVETWKNDAPVYCCHSSFLMRHNIKDFPRIGKLKKIGEKFTFYPFYLFVIYTAEELKEVKLRINRQIPNAMVCIYPRYVNHYWNTRNTLNEIHVTCFSKTDAALCKLVLDLKKSDYDRS